MDNTKRRTNKDMSGIVEIAASMADNGLVDHAAGICAKSNVPLDVAMRVLTRPKERRKDPEVDL